MAPARPASRRCRAALAVGISCLSVLAVACSGTSRPTVAPATAAQTLTAVYSLSRAQQQCLERAFAADKAATRPLASNGPASDADLAALGAVARACITSSTLADAVVGGAGGGTQGLSPTQQSCVRSAVAGLDADDQATMLAGLAVPTALGDIQTALLGKITDRILTTCHIAVTGSSIPDVSETDTSA